MKINTLLLYCIVLLAGCRGEEEIINSTAEKVTGGADAGDVAGFFLLNEGNMGSNKATLDYFDYETGVYHRNIYEEINPGVIKQLGDVGNDIQVYGGKLYAVINCSHLVEVMDVESAVHVARVSIPNCRYITFHDRYAYVTSYAGPVKIDPNARLGYVARVDTASLEVLDTCIVGYQPEEMVIVGDKMYVANSGGYRVPDYDRTVSVIDLAEFRVIKTIDIGINLHRLEADARGYIYVSSRGDYYNVPSKTYVIDSGTDTVVDELPLLPNSNMTLHGDSLYVYSAEWSHVTSTWAVSYAILNTLTRKVVSRDFIKDDTKNRIVTPYGIAVHPVSGEILVCDATDYVTPGRLYCFGKDGMLRWSVTTGDIPARVVFTRKKLKFNK